MTRIPYVHRDELGPEGQQLWDTIVKGRGDRVVAGEGLAGPFNAYVTAPGVGRRLSSLGATLRFGTSIERRLIEVAILTTGARWQAEFEWWAHASMAREHGVPDAVADAIGRGEEPPFESDDERAVYDVARQLSDSGHLDQKAYDAAHRFLGDAGMVELVSLCGYYTLVSFLLNAFAVPLPPDAAPMWVRSLRDHHLLTTGEYERQISRPRRPQTGRSCLVRRELARCEIARCEQARCEQARCERALREQAA